MGKNEIMEKKAEEPAIDKYLRENYELLKDLLNKSGCDLTDNELQTFCIMARKYDLDPFLGEIYAIKYKRKNGTEKMNIFASRDGYMTIAHRHPMYDGMNCDTEIRDGKLYGWCEVYRKDMSHPFRVAVPYSEYAMNGNLWSKDQKPETMIKKVAMAQCHKFAFRINGLYSEDEQWEQDNNNGHSMRNITPRNEQPQQDITPQISILQLKDEIMNNAKLKGYTQDDLKTIMKGVINTSTFKGISRDQLNTLAQHISTLPSKPHELQPIQEPQPEVISTPQEPVIDNPINQLIILEQGGKVSKPIYDKMLLSYFKQIGFNEDHFIMALDECCKDHGTNEMDETLYSFIVNRIKTDPKAFKDWVCDTYFNNMGSGGIQ